MWTGCEAVGGGDEAGRVKAEGGQVLRKGGCEGRGRDESIRSEQASGVGVGGGRAGETRRGGRWPVGGRDKVCKQGNSNPWGSRPAQILRKSARVREEQEKCTHLEQVEHFKESLPTSREQMEQG